MAKNNPKPSEITSEQVYKERRKWIKGLAVVGTGLATAGLYKAFSPSTAKTEEDLESEAGLKQPETNLVLTQNQEILQPTNYQDITNYNNYYEFSTDKSAVADLSSKWKRPEPWTIEIGGLVAKPRTIDMDLLKLLGDEERIYRFRCVEAWSMIIPWNGFSLSKLLQLVEPLTSAKYVAFETYFDAKEMPSAIYGGLDFPYVEGLRLDEAMHPLTMIATGIYGKPLLNQNGAPTRLVVPWKYGFKSIKSIVRITLTETEPKATWNSTNPREYGFYSNVNPEVSHPRWSQANERVIGSLRRQKTLMFNGYADQVAHLYGGMNLKEYF